MCPCSENLYREAHKDVCPICGERIRITGQTDDLRLIGSCGDAFPPSRYYGERPISYDVKPSFDAKYAARDQYKARLAYLRMHMGPEDTDVLAIVDMLERASKQEVVA